MLGRLLLLPHRSPPAASLAARLSSSCLVAFPAASSAPFAALVAASQASRPAVTMAAAAAIAFWDRSPPFAALATAKLGGVPLEVKPDMKGNKDMVAVLAVEG